VPVDEGFGRAREAVNRALELRPDLAEAYTELGWVQMNGERDFRRAQLSFAHALELAPSNAHALRRAGILSGNLGRTEEAIGLYFRAAEQDPLVASGYYNLGWALFAVGRFEEAEAWLRKGLGLAPQGIIVHASLAVVLVAQGRGQEAVAEALLEPHHAFRPWGLAIVHHLLGHDAESDAALRELLEVGPAASFQIAEVYAARGETDAAFEWLERGFVEHDPGINEAMASPLLRSLHGDPRWQAFLKKMGLDG
jgi:tetratricopeptide (TPR) repeat protein